MAVLLGIVAVAGVVSSLGPVDVVRVSAPQTVVTPSSVANSFVSPARVTADSTGATIAWLEGATATKACVKAVRVGRDAVPSTPIELDCATMPSTTSPIAGPLIAGGATSLIVWSKDGVVIGQLITGKLASTPAFRTKLAGDEQPRALGWDGTQYWLLNVGATTLSVQRISATGKADAPQKLAVQPDGLEGPWLRCMPDDCVVVSGRSRIDLVRGQVGKPVTLEDWRKHWEILVPALRDRDLVATRAVWMLRELATVATSAGTLVALEAGTSWEGDVLEVQLVGADGQRHRPYSLVHESLADVAAFDDTHFVLVTRGKGGTLAHVVTADPAKLVAPPAMPAMAKLHVAVSPAKITEVSIDVARPGTPDRFWTTDVKTDATGALDIEVPAGTAWVNAYEGGMFGGAAFQMIDVSAAKPTELKLKLGQRESIFLSESFQSHTVRVPDVNGLTTSFGNENVYTDPIAPGRHWLLLDDDTWRMQTLVDVPSKRSNDTMKLRFKATLAPGDPGIKLAQDGTAVVITSVAPGSAALAQKLAPGDALLAIDGKPVVDYVDACARVFGAPGKPVKLRVRGAKAKADRTVTLTRAK